MGGLRLTSDAPSTRIKWCHANVMSSRQGDESKIFIVFTARVVTFLMRSTM